MACPVCSKGLSGWQGKDGPCGLFVWQEGVAAPIDQSVSDDVRLEPAALAQVRLPASFTIYVYCCSSTYPVEAACLAPDGLWGVTELVTVANASQRKEETRAAFKARLKWLGKSVIDMKAPVSDESLVTALAGALVSLNEQFQLPCGKCWRIYKAEMRWGYAFDEAHRGQIAAEFAQVGWDFVGGMAICPSCKGKSANAS